MIDQTAALLALRGRALALVVCTTGAVALTATATGYSRSIGSFIEDGFRVGMEIAPSGFLANPVDTIQSVTDLAIVTKNGRTAEGLVATASLTVGLPAIRAWENERVTVASRQLYVEESLVPATQRLLSLPASAGSVEETGLYVLRVFGLAETGVSVRVYANALLAQYAPGTAVTVGADTLRVRTDVSPYAGQVLRIDGGWAAITLTIPWRATTMNQIAA